MTYALGFRDHFSMKIDEIIDKICLLESRVGANDEAEATSTIHGIREAVKQSTHMYVHGLCVSTPLVPGRGTDASALLDLLSIPHYHVISTPLGYKGFFGRLVDSARRILIEGLYRRIEVMFPETGNWVGSADQ